MSHKTSISRAGGVGIALAAVVVSFGAQSAAAVPATREVASEAIRKPAISVESTFLDDMARFLFLRMKSPVRQTLPACSRIWRENETFI